MSKFINGSSQDYQVGGTDVAVTDGGTGASSAAAARDNLVVPGRFLSVGQTDNLGITYSGNVLSITQANGNALSSTAGSQGRVVVPSTTAGQQIVLQVTAAQTLQDAGHGTPQILGRWGTTASVAWGNALPLFLGVANKDDTDAGLRFFLTRDPTKTTTPSSTNNIGIAGTAPATSSESNIVLFGTTANTGYNSVPCVIIGSVQATCDNSSGGSWTIGNLTAGRDGIGLFQEHIDFIMPLGQNGATSGKYIKDNGGTAPTFTDVNIFYYRVQRNGKIILNIQLRNTSGGTPGATSGNILIPAPYPAIPALNGQSILIEGNSFAAGQTVNSICLAFFSGSVSLYDINILRQTTINTATTSLANTDFTGVTRSIFIYGSYSAF